MTESRSLPEGHVVSEVGLHQALAGDDVVGRATVVEEMCVPRTDALRTSVVLTWADIVAGAVAGRAMEPRIPLTLDLEVQVARPARPGQVVAAEATLVRAGRTIVVTECWFRDADDGTPLAYALASFVPAPDPTAVFPDGFPITDLSTGRLAVPLAERVGCRVVEPGTVEMPRRPDGLNAVGAIQGGLAAVALEEAVTSTTGSPRHLSSLVVRYLRPVMQGPAIAVSAGAGEVHTVRLTDAAVGKLCLVATARLASLSEIL